MLRMTLDVTAVAGTRFAVSPLWETVAALDTLADPARRELHRPWVAWARRRIESDGLRLPLVWSVLIDRDRPGWPVRPEFLMPAPASREPSFEEELDRMRASPPAGVRESLDRIFGGNRPATADELHRHPDRGLRAAAAELRAAHELLVAPLWTRMRNLLDADIAYRSGLLAVGGADRLFADLHDRLAWDRGELVLRSPRDGEPATDVHLGPGGLVLVPSVFAWPGVCVKIRTVTQTTLRYPARGVGALWETDALDTRSADGVDPVARLIGRPRARVLAAVRSPATTTDLARRLGVTPSAVSQHLSVLCDAGLVSRERRGRWVLYAATDLARALCDRTSALS